MDLTSPGPGCAGRVRAAAPARASRPRLPARAAARRVPVAGLLPAQLGGKLHRTGRLHGEGRRTPVEVLEVGTAPEGVPAGWVSPDPPAGELIAERFDCGLSQRFGRDSLGLNGPRSGFGA